MVPIERPRGEHERRQVGAVFLAVLVGGLILVSATGCGREEGAGGSAGSSRAGRGTADGPIAGLQMDTKSAALLGAWLEGTYHLGRAGVNKASVDYHVVWAKNYFREPIEHRGHFVYDADAATPDWDPAAPDALLTRWIDAASFRKDYASAVFTAQDQPDGRVRVQAGRHREARRRVTVLLALLRVAT